MIVLLLTCYDGGIQTGLVAYIVKRMLKKQVEKLNDKVNRYITNCEVDLY